MTVLCIFLGLLNFSTAYHNLALNKPSYQLIRYKGLSEDLTEAGNAVDGLKSNLSVWGGECVISENEMKTAVWFVDLQDILSIHHITIYYRTENAPWGRSNQNESLKSRFLGFSLYISNTTNKSREKLCFKDTNFTLDTIPAVFNTTCFEYGRFVIYYNERLPGVTYPNGYSTFAYNELCEVEVYGCPEYGYYGEDCSIPCRDPHCRYCHLESGTCQRCQPGYYGGHCELECPDGKYGDGCQMDCGHCTDLRQCHHVNGTCLRGCAIGYIGDECKSCENRKFGHGCNITCGHCLNQDYCHQDNGACPSGCEPGYGGDLCKTQNIAVNKTAYLEYRFLGLSKDLTGARNAVDGLKTDLSVQGGQCVISENEMQTATWWVNLAKIHSIHHITIYYRTGNVEWGTFNGFTQRFLGFSLYISNTTDKSDGVMCFKDTNFTLETIPAVFNITCPALGQYVIYYNERLEGVTYPDGYSTHAFNELCEVEVYGCHEEGYYGEDCSIPCPDPHCRYCHLETGTCQGCQPGYKGHRCELKCSYGKYGVGCEVSCGQCMYKGLCHHVNGTCLDGCEQGYTGETCIFCDNRKYGQMCNKTCGHCLNQGFCHHENGACLSGCDPGFHGELCTSYNIAFKKPTYQQYPYTGLPENIVRADNAVDGLKSNLSAFGEQCVISEDGAYDATFWVNLTSILSIHHITIYYRTDNKHWGQSNHYASRFLGFSLYVSNTTSKSDGILCFQDNIFTLSTIPAVFNTTCPVQGQYVIYYNERSPNKTYPDEYSTYAYNELCEVEVIGCPEPGFYGSDCSMPCPDLHCRYCHLETGACQGCEPGYHGHHCELKCYEEHLGVECRHICGHCKICNHTTETCLNGCEPGFKGDNCLLKCEKGTYGSMCHEACGECSFNQTCHFVTGFCPNGCNPGFYGDLCNRPCAVGFFGQNCSRLCNNTCTGCNNLNGICDTGCLPGWRGKYCEEPETTMLNGSQHFNKCGTDVGAYAAISILSFLLTIAIGVIVLQRRQFHSSLIKRQNKEDIKKQIQDKSRNDTQYYDNVTALDEHQYISIDSKHQVSHYHNMP
uniref:Protein draper-like isoform X1 n=1 Tax=Crassostrea virginica TaxID=6565 RepID=A0A8B8BZZ4_CRAVI|nr:protein draper-like isoform X1 [Crassostrea virginica]